jgi:hypothetical protein
MLILKSNEKIESIHKKECVMCGDVYEKEEKRGNINLKK